MTDKIQILIYVVDDNEVDLEFIMRYLQSDTFDIKCFTNPIELKDALNEDVSMVITDIKMDNYDIYISVNEIKDRFPGIYIIAMSGYLSLEIYERLIDCHVWYVVDKNKAGWLDDLKRKVELTVPKMLNKKMAQHDD